MTTSTVENWERVLSGKLDQYSVFRVILKKSGLRFYSQPIDRSKVDSLLRNQPAGMVDIEGLAKQSFEPDQWEIISIL